MRLSLLNQVGPRYPRFPEHTVYHPRRTCDMMPTSINPMEDNGYNNLVRLIGSSRGINVIMYLEDPITNGIGDPKTTVKDLLHSSS